MPVSNTTPSIAIRSTTDNITTQVKDTPQNFVPSLQHESTPIQQVLSDEDLSLHGSSIMDETEENEHGLNQIMDGYDFLSSADSDIEIMDQASSSNKTAILSPNIEPSARVVMQQPPTMSVSSSSSSSSYLSSQSAVSNTTSDAIINETASVDPDYLELDERVSGPEMSETTSITTTTRPMSGSPIKQPVTAQVNQEPNTSTTTANSSSSTEPNQASTVPTSSCPSTTSSDFVFKPPAIPKISTHNQTTQPTKVVNLSSSMPTNTGDGSSSSNDVVQGRTIVSKGGDVRVEGYSDSDLDLQDIIDRLNTNKNKKRRFKPRAPTSRNIKQRLTWIVNNITQTILDKTNP
ncbi:hypothetical protein G6F42_014171 [Rhizopus arrhizus]|nr:hypothetical protein G6F42_014171 [Rhizopus arrhizus]